MTSARVRRWGEVGALAGFATVAAVLLYGAGRELPLILGERVHLFRPWVCWTAAVAAIIAGSLVAVQATGLRLAHLRYEWAYPSIWTAAALACLLLAAVSAGPIRPTVDVIPFGRHLAALAATWCGLVVFVPLVMFLIGLRRRQPEARDQVTAADIENWMTLAAWVAREEPASDLVLDLFSTRAVAQRLARELGTRGHTRSIALLGAYGSGKTTVIRWAAQLIARSSNARIWFCEISCWGLGESGELPKYILSQAIRCLQQRVNCLSNTGPARRVSEDDHLRGPRVAHGNSPRIRRRRGGARAIPGCERHSRRPRCTAGVGGGGHRPVWLSLRSERCATVVNDAP